MAISMPSSLSSSASSSSPVSPSFERLRLPSVHSRCFAFLHRFTTEASIHLNFSFYPSRERSDLFCARSKSRDDEFLDSATPFQPRSATGLFLRELLHTNPELVPAAVEHELEVLSDKREVEACQHKCISSGADQDLYRRIFDLKCQERFNALEEILYVLVVKKFMEARIMMVSNIQILSSTAVPWPMQVRVLESIHSIEVVELIREHSLLMLGKRGPTMHLRQSMFAHLKKMSLKEIYASSVKYGYFLRRFYNRFHLEKSMELHSHSDGSFKHVKSADVMKAMAVLKDLQGSIQTPHLTQIMTGEFLAYITSFDIEALQKYSIVRSKESQSVLEKHIQALFQGIEIQRVSDGFKYSGSEGDHEISYLKSKCLLLEAVTFGSFLWDVETYVDGFYNLITI